MPRLQPTGQPVYPIPGNVEFIIKLKKTCFNCLPHVVNADTRRLSLSEHFTTTIIFPNTALLLNNCHYESHHSRTLCTLFATLYSPSIPAYFNTIKITEACVSIIYRPYTFYYVAHNYFLSLFLTK